MIKRGDYKGVASALEVGLSYLQLFLQLISLTKSQSLEVSFRTSLRLLSRRMGPTSLISGPLPSGRRTALRRGGQRRV